ncbi:MAG: hypothetical protein KDI80_05410 [Xanthomonadales bacterium]|nr:hypothetical protein [Xanthomonadales bacterium]
MAPLLVFLALFACAAQALDEGPTVPGYYRKVWTTESGAPSYIRAIEQSPEGFLWLGSDTGLYRFDGVEFTRFEPPLDPALPVGPVTALAMEPDGALWVAISGDGVVRVEGGRIVFHQTIQGPKTAIQKILTGPANARLMMSSSGLFQFTGRDWVAVDTPGLPGGVRFYDVRFGDDGSLWVATAAGIFSRRDAGGTFVQRSEGPPGSGRFARARSGHLWYCGQSGGLLEFDLDSSLRRSNPAFPCYWLSIDRQDVAWTDAPEGAGIAPVEHWIGQSASAIRASLTNGIFGDELLTAFLQDKEGSVWLGLADGLRQFRPNRMHGLDQAQGNGGIAAAADGGLWFISYSRGLMHVGEETRIFPRAGKALTYVDRDRRGIVWVGGWHRKVLIRVEGSKISEIPFPPGDEDVFVNGISVQSDGSPWVFTQPAPAGAVYHYVDGRWLERGGVAGLPEEPAHAVFVDTSDRVWLSYAGSRLFVVTGNMARAVPGATALDMGNLRSITQLGEDIVIAGDEGLAVFRDGAFHRISLQPPARLLGIVNILPTRNGDLWINQSASLLRIPAGQLHEGIEHDTPVAAEFFDFTDGRSGTPIKVAPHPTLAETDDGRLVVSAATLSWLDPADIERNRVVPAAGFRFVSINGVKSSRPTSAIRLRNDDEELVIGYRSSSIAVPERVQYKYRLEGLDANWRSGNAQREVSYNPLRPGSYTFSIMASNNDGVWSSPTTLSVEVPPPYYQTAWFAALSLTSLIMLIVLVVQARTRWVAERIRERMQERSSERERIARELHDTLLQGIQGLILQFHLVADDLPASDPNRKRMEGALDRADRLMSEGRHRVNDLRLQGVGASLGASLHRQLLEDGLSAGPQLKVREWGASQALVPMVQTELLRIVHEAVSNAIHHGACKRLRLVIRYDRDALRVRIKDDGCGISDEDLGRRKPGHWGITGMHERAASIGAQLAIMPGKHSGTVVDIAIPAGRAYANPGRGRWCRVRDTARKTK